MRNAVAGGVLLLGTLASCSDSQEEPGEPVATPATPTSPPPEEPATSQSLRQRFLLDDIRAADTNSFLVDALSNKPQAKRYPLSELTSDGVDPTTGHHILRLPAPFARNESDAPVMARLWHLDKPLNPELADDDSEPVVDLRLVPEEFEFRVATLPQFDKGWAKPRTPEGDASVLLNRPCTIEIPLHRVGVPMEIGVNARGVGIWDPTNVPTIRFLCDGEEVYRLNQNKSADELSRFELPAAVGSQTLTVLVEDIERGDDTSKIALHTLGMHHQGGGDRAFVHTELPLDEFEVEYLPASPAGIQGLKSSRPARGIESVTTRVQVVPGRAAVTVDPPQLLEISMGGRVLATPSEKGATREFPFVLEESGPAELTARSLDGPLKGRLWLLQPNATYQQDLAPLRGFESEETDHPLVRHVQLGKTTRRSLLLPASSRITFAGQPGTLTFALGMLPADRETLLTHPPKVQVLRVSDDGEEVLKEVKLKETLAFKDHSIELSSWKATDQIQFRCIGPKATPVAARQMLVVVAEPTITSNVAKPRKPNLLVYLIDTLRADHLSCYGYERETSPHIDALADDGVLFERAYSQAPWTRPSIATLMTGLLYSFHGAGKTSGLAPELLTLPELLHQAEYNTAAFIANAQIHGLGLNFVQGFQSFTAVDENAGQSRAGEVLDQVYPWLDANGDTPFFLYVHTIDPHAKYDPPAETAGTFNKGYEGKLNPKVTGSRSLEALMPLSDTDVQYVIDLYDEEILYNDLEFGRLVQKLKDLGLYEDTAILVISDHGEEFGEHGQFGHGGRLWDTLLQVPMVLKLPGEDRARGIRVEDPVRLMDVYPTLASMLDAPFPAGTCQGTDLSSMWKSESLPEPLSIIAEEQPELRCLVLDGVKVIQQNYDNEHKPEVRHLFDLRKDPGEFSDLAAEYPDRAENFVSHLLGHLQGYRAAGFEPINNILDVRLTEENMEALRALGYIE